MRFYNSFLSAGIAAIYISSPVVAQDWPKETNPEWDATLLAGQSDGELVLAGAPQLSGDFIEQFETDTSIDVVFVTGPHSELGSRFIREVEANAATIDIFFSGPNTFPLLETEYLMAIPPILVLPEVTNGENWRQGKIPFADTVGQYMPVPSLYLSGRTLVNTNNVDPETISTWDDLLRPEFKGKIITQFAPTFGGCLTLAAYLMQEKGAEFVEAFYIGQEIVTTREYRDVTDGVARGTYTIGLSARPSDITKYQQEGIDYLAVLGMADVSGYIVAGSAVTTVATNGPNPNASAVFMNWLLSQRGQTAFSAAFSVPSERLDVTDGDWPKSIEPLPGQGYQNNYSQDWRQVERLPFQDAAVSIILQ